VRRGPTAVGSLALTALAVVRLREHGARVARRATASAVRAEAVDEAVAQGVSQADERAVLAIVMAAYNEAGSVGRVLEDLPETVCGLIVRPVVIDDGSADGTAEEAREAGAVVGSHARNLGQGDALRTGFAMARLLDARAVVTMDADGQHDPAELASLVSPIVSGDADYVQGSRFLGTDDDAGGARDLGIRGFTLLIRWLTHAKITDCTNGYRAIDGAGLARLKLVEDRFSASEILIQAAGHGLRIREVPVHIRSREIGASKKPRGLGYAGGFLGAIVRSWARAHDPRSGSREPA
jgi:glycosyltransferase involved in cell wall biosynthesis